MCLPCDRMKRTLKNGLAALGLLALATFGITGCKGPERAPRHVIPGVDKPAEDPGAKSRPSR